MKKKLWILIMGMLYICILLSAASSAEKSQRSLTIMIYMCGSNLESDFGSASADLQEIIGSGYDRKKTEVLILAGGSKTWRSGYSPDATHLLRISPGGSAVEVAKESSALRDMGAPDTLSWFLQYGYINYPADQYALIIWDHGGGPLETACVDELFSQDGLSLEEMCDAFESAHLPQKLSWIGFDACLMGSVEVANALSPYADYMIASQEREPAAGWNYEFLNGIEADHNGGETGKRIIQKYFEALANDPNPLTLACIDLTKLQEALPSMDAFFFNAGSAVNTETYSDLSVVRLDSASFGKAVKATEVHSYDLVDLQDLMKKMGKNGNEQRAVSLLNASVVYSKSTVPGATGLTVYHPFSNKEDYTEKWMKRYADVSFCANYQNYINAFGAILVGDRLADWRGLLPNHDQKNAQAARNFTLKLTDAQIKNYARAQLIILAAYEKNSGIYGITESRDTTEKIYSPVSIEPAGMDANGVLSGEFVGRTLYVTDEEGNAVCGPLTYTLSDDGKDCYIQGTYYDHSGRENPADDLDVLYSFSMDTENGNPLKLSGIMGYDKVEHSFTSRVPVDPSQYTLLSFKSDGRLMPHDQENMPGFDEWKEADAYQNTSFLSIDVPQKWQLRFFETQMSAVQLYAIFQITDSQQNTHASLPVPILNPNLEDVQIEPRITETDDYRIRFFLIKDTSPLNPGLNLAAEVTNLSEWTTTYAITDLLLNREQSGSPGKKEAMRIPDVRPGETRTYVLHLDQTAIINLESITGFSFRLQMLSDQHVYEYTERRIRFFVSQCSLDGISEIKQDVLGRIDNIDLSLELLSIDREASGNIHGILRITNHTKKPLYEQGYWIINHLLIASSENLVSLNIPAEATAYYAFTYQNRCYLHNEFSAGGRQIEYTLNEDSQLERQGVQKIESLQLLFWNATKPRTMTLELDTPIPLNPIQTEPSETKALMEGQICAEVERIFIADDGIGLRIVFSNPTDQDVSILAGGWKVNGILPKVVEKAESFAVPAHGKTVQCIGINAPELLSEEEAPKKIELAFRVNNEYCSTPAVIEISETDTGRYLKPDTCSVIPAKYSRPEIAFDSDQASIGPYMAQIKGCVCNGNPDDPFSMFDSEKVYLSFAIYISNFSGNTGHLRFSNLSVNTDRAVDVSWGEMEIKPAGTSDATVYITDNSLLGITELKQISFNASILSEESDSESAMKLPVHFDLHPLDLIPLIADRPSVLASQEQNSLLWQALDLQTDDANGSVSIDMYIKNQSEEATTIHSFDIYLNGWFFGEKEQFILQPSQDIVLHMYLKNRIELTREELEVSQRSEPIILEERILQHREIEKAEEIRIVPKNNEAPGFSFKLIEPVPLSGNNEAESLDGLELINTPVSLLVRKVLIGNWDIAVQTDWYNMTDETMNVSLTTPKVNGQYYLPETITEFCLPPHTGQTNYFILRYDKWTAVAHQDETTILKQGDNVRDISFTVLLNNEVIPVTFSIAGEAQIGARGGKHFGADKLLSTVPRADMLIHTYAELTAAENRSVSLSPALDETQREKFVYGTAIVYLEKDSAYRYRVVEQDGDNYDVYLPEYQRICTLDLHQSEDGLISTEYSGLAWVNTVGDLIEGYESAEGLDGNNLETEGKRLLFVEGDIYENWTAFRYVPPKGSSKIREKPVLQLGAGYEVDFTGSNPLIVECEQEIYNLRSEIVTDSFLENGENMVCVGKQEIIVEYQGNLLERREECREIIRMGDLRLVNVDQLPGSLIVIYDIFEQDGSFERLYESYPYE